MLIALKRSLLRLQAFKDGEGAISIKLIASKSNKDYLFQAKLLQNLRFTKGGLQYFQLIICKRHSHFLQLSKALMIAQFLHETTSNAKY